MIKNKMIAIFLSIFLLLTMNSCGAGSVSNDVADIDNSPINDDELVEVTPNNIRLRKVFLDPHERKRLSRAKSKAS